MTGQKTKVGHHSAGGGGQDPDPQRLLALVLFVSARATMKGRGVPIHSHTTCRDRAGGIFDGTPDENNNNDVIATLRSFRNITCENHGGQ